MEEFEILTFRLGNETFGINVDNILEIIRADYLITHMPNSKPNVLGVFKPRDSLINALDLKGCLFNKDNEVKDLLYKRDLTEKEKQILHNMNFIICSCDNELQGWLVDEVHDIFRLPKKDIKESPIVADKGKNIVGIYNDKENDTLVQIINLEKIFNKTK